MQSLYNLVALFQGRCDFYLISLNKDIDGSVPIEAMDANVWSKGPYGENIYSTPSISPFLIVKLIRQVQPNVIFINGIFNFKTTLPGIVAAKWLGIKLIISPRGMLQAWALKRNTSKKKIGIALLKFILNNRENWHATDEQERNDIVRIFGPAQQINVASNIPRSVSSFKEVNFLRGIGKIRLIFLSLINPNKNLHLIIDEVNAQPDSLALDIYGPVLDQKYWELCQSKMNANPSISYKGPIPPWQVPSILKDYHFFVLPTEGENFGHAIFDALSAGVPVIITQNTPWKEVDTFPAGFYVDLNESRCLRSIFDRVRNLEPEKYQAIRKGSFSYAVEYMARRDITKEYSFLINN